ncbi:MAG TPA: P-loop NTPase [Rhodothermales bacterium]|nr:P-loop NTPase [Rhodothermales bacterium]
MKRDCTTIAITSGKGGVGKSVAAVNLAETLARAGRRVTLLDADFGQGACPLLLNEAPETSLLEAIRRGQPVATALHRTSGGLTLVHCVPEAGEAEKYEHALYAGMDDLLAQLRRTSEFILIDTPAGTEGPVRWALDRADVGLLVVVGEPTAIADSYRLAKMVWQADPAYPMATLVNFADSKEEALGIAERFGHVTQHFTGQVPNFLGWVPFSVQIRRSVQEQSPAVRTPGPVRTAFEEAVDVLVHGRRLAQEAVSLLN